MSFQTGIKTTRKGFNKIFGASPEAVAYAPGRINLIGDHTDYNGGLALPAAINRWVYVGASRRENPGIRVYAESEGLQAEWRIGEPDPEAGWMRFAQGAYVLLNHNFAWDFGFELYIRGDIPQGAGLSSSAALGVALLKSLCTVTGETLPHLELCKMAQQIEHQFLGIETGLLDQMAVVYGKSNMLLEIDFQDNSVRYHSIPDLGIKWVIIDSGVQRELAASGYQQRVEETRAGLKAVQKLDAGVKHFRDLELHLLEEESPEGGENHFRRLRHYVSENERVGDFVQHLNKGDLKAAGEVLNQSHWSLRDDYESSHSALDWLQEEAVKIDGCFGSRIMGGGFGGCTINLVESVKANAFVRTLLKKYRKKGDIEGQGFVFARADGAQSIHFV